MGSAVSLPESGHAYSVGQVPRYPPVTGARAVPPLPSQSLTAEDAPVSNGLSNESDPMSLSTAPTTAPADDRRKKRAAVARFALAGVAVLGIGAAATSAAWTNDAWFAGDASAATIGLQGSLDGSTWITADPETNAVDLTIDDIQDMVPGQTEAITLHLQNTSPVPLSLSQLMAPITSGAVTVQFTGSTTA